MTVSWGGRPGIPHLQQRSKFVIEALGETGFMGGEGALGGISKLEFRGISQMKVRQSKQKKQYA